jgi:hypothetical protein
MIPFGNFSGEIRGASRNSHQSKKETEMERQWSGMEAKPSVLETTDPTPKCSAYEDPGIDLMSVGTIRHRQILLKKRRTCCEFTILKVFVWMDISCTEKSEQCTG